MPKDCLNIFALCLVNLGNYQIRNMEEQMNNFCYDLEKRRFLEVRSGSYRISVITKIINIEALRCLRQPHGACLEHSCRESRKNAGKSRILRFVGHFWFTFMVNLWKRYD